VEKTDAPASPGHQRRAHLLSRGGFGVQEGYWFATYLRHGASGLISAHPDCPAVIPPTSRRVAPAEAAEDGTAPGRQFPMIVPFAETYQGERTRIVYFTFGIDLLGRRRGDRPGRGGLAHLADAKLVQRRADPAVRVAVTAIRLLFRPGPARSLDHSRWMLGSSSCATSICARR